MQPSATNTVKVLVLGPRRRHVRALLAALGDVRVLAPDDPQGFGVEAATRVARQVRVDVARVELTSELALSLLAFDDGDALRGVWDEVADGLLGALVLVEAGALDDIERAAALVRTAAELGVTSTVVLRHGGGGAKDEGEALRAALRLDGCDVIDVDPSDRDHGRNAVLALLQATLRTRTGLDRTGLGSTEVREGAATRQAVT